MPKNKTGGSSHKKQKNKPIGGKIRRAIDIAKSDDPKDYEVYGRILRPLGNRRMEVYCQTHSNPAEYQTITCRIRGSFRTNIGVDDYVLVQLYDFNTKQGQIVDSYSSDEVIMLHKDGRWDMTRTKPINGPSASAIESDISDMSDISDSDSDADTDDSDIQYEDTKNNIDLI